MTTAAREALLAPEVAEAAMSPQASVGAGSIGFGFLVGKVDGRRCIAHGGGGIGARTSLLALPDDGLVAVSLTNRWMEIQPLNHRVLERALAIR